MYYLALLNLSGNVTKCDPAKEQRTDNTSGRALQCGRRMFLASLILASKYLQDRNYFTKAWSRISNLSVVEINRNEMALLGALDYKLHIKTTEFQRWTDCISKCTTSVQRGLHCPWTEGLKCMNLWRGTAASDPSAHALVARGPGANRPARLTGTETSQLADCSQPRASTLPSHRLNLLRAGQSVCPTRPIRLPTRTPALQHGDSQWPGMAAHLACATQSTAQFSASPEALLGADLARASQQPRQSGEDLPLSPPKTPSPRSGDGDVEMREQGPEIGSLMQETTISGPAPPPAPREPLVSLNTTPDSNDGVSTFGNYLGPITNASGQGMPQQLSHPSDARFQADTLGGESANEHAVPELDSPSSSPSAGSFDLPSPTLEPAPFARCAYDGTVKHPALQVMDTDFNVSEQDAMVLPDQAIASVGSDVEVETRRLTRKEIPTNPTPAEDGIYRTASKKCRAHKQTSCHRRKRGPSSFNGLSDRTNKAMRV